jgi:CubicO group peptidase (beta-lactamase class C family)
VGCIRCPSPHTFGFLPQALKSNVLWLAEFSASNWEIRIGSGKICQAPTPILFAYSPPRPSNDLIAKASKDVDKYLLNRASKPDVDSIAVSIVTAAGPLFEAGYGILKANETDETDMEETHPVNRDSIYRIASISKMFTVLETLILRERGALNWYSSPLNRLNRLIPSINFKNSIGMIRSRNFCQNSSQLPLDGQTI